MARFKQQYLTITRFMDFLLEECWLVAHVSDRAFVLADVIEGFAAQVRKVPLKRVGQMRG